MPSSVERMVKLIFEGDDRVSKVMSSIEGNVSRFSGNIESATAPLADIAQKAVLAEGALAAMVAGGIVYATNEAGKFNDSFREISTLIDDTGDNISVFRQDILDYGRDASSSYDEINSAVYSAISAGIDYKDSLETLDQAEKLSIAGKAKLNDSLVLIASSLNAYGEEVDQAEKYSDVFFQTVKLGQTTIPELSQSLSQVTGIAASGGVPIETLAAAISAVTAAGVPTSQTMTSLKAAISNIIKPSSEAQKTAAALGIEFNATALKTRGFETILQDVYQATGGNVDQMAKLFGSTEALNAVLVLAEDKSGRFAEALQKMQSASGSTEAAYEKMADSMNLINQGLINNITATVVEFGSNFLDEWQGIAEGVGNIFKGVSVAMDDGSFDPVITFIEQVGRDIENYVKKIAEAIPEALEDVDFSGLLSSIRELGGSVRNLFEAFFGDLDLTKPEDLARALQKISDSAETLTRITKGIADGLEPFVAGLGRLVEKAVDADPKTEELAGKVLGFATGVNKAVGELNAIGPALSVLAGASMVNAIANVTSLAGGLGKIGPAAGVVAAGGLGVFAGTMIDKYVPGVSEGAQKIFELADRVLNFTGTQGKANEMLDKSGKSLEEARRKFEQYRETTGRVDEALEDFFGNYDALSKDLELDFEQPKTELDELKDKLRETGVLVEQLTEEKKLKIDADLTEFFEDIDAAGKKIQYEIIEWFDEAGNRQTLTVPIQVDAETGKAEKEIEKITGEKELEIKLKGDIEKELKQIETSAETIQTALEWQAKVDIAQAEAAARIMESAFASVSASIVSTENLLGGLFDKLAGLSRGSVRSTIERAIRDEQENRQKLVEAQVRLLNEQANALELMNRKRRQGEAVYTFEAKDIEPHLVAIWKVIVEKIQVQAVEEGLEGLIGV